MIERGGMVCVDDVKGITLREKEKTISAFYGYFHKKEFNGDHYTNLVLVPVLGWVMFNLLRSQSSLDFFSIAILSIKQ